MRFIIVPTFMAVQWFFVNTLGGFSMETVSSLFCSLAVVIVFWLSVEIVAFLRDNPLFDTMEYLVSALDKLGALIVMLFMYAIVSIFVGAAIHVLALHFPEAFSGAGLDHPSYHGEAARRGFSLVLVFGGMYAFFDFPVRVSSLWKKFRKFPNL